MSHHPPLTWGPKPHCAGLFARILDCEEAHVMFTSQGWTAYAGSARLTPPIPGPLWASQAEAMSAVARAVGCAPLAPVCPACNGYGSADGLPCGTHERDFGSEAPAACAFCGGRGEPANVRCSIEIKGRVFWRSYPLDVLLLGRGVL